MIKSLLALAMLVGFVLPADAQDAGTIEGTLTDEQTGAPIAAVNTPGNGPLVTVVVCPTSTPACANAPTAQLDAAGHYIIQNLVPGTYYLKVVAQEPYISEVHADVLCATASSCLMEQGAPITVAAGASTTVNVALTKGGTIAGTVRGADTGGGVYRQIYVFTPDGTLIRQPYTGYNDQAGVYSIGSLPPGQYYLRTGYYTNDYVISYVDVLYPNVPCGVGWAACPLALGSLVSVTTGATTTVDFSLPRGGTISGTITARDTGAPLGTSSPLYVYVMALNAAVGRGVAADAIGNYTIAGLPPGSYYVRVTTSSSPNPPPYVPTYHGGACDGCSDGQKTAVALTLGSTVTSIDIAAATVTPATGSISGGFSTSMTGWFSYTALCARVAAYDGGGRLAATGRFIRPDDAVTWPTGYVIEKLPAGTYFVRFEDPACSHWRYGSGGDSPDQIFGYGACVTEDCDVRRGAPVTVVPNATTAGIDFVVHRGASINTPVGDLFSATNRVELYDARGVRVNRNRMRLPVAFQGPVGPPSFVGLPAGTYYARTVDGRLHPGLFCPDCPATAGKPIAVAAGGHASATLNAGTATDAARTISGTVRDAVTQAPLSNVRVGAYDLAGTPASSTTTDVLGRYTLPSPILFGVSRIWPGDYFLHTGNLRGYEDRRYLNRDCAGCEPTQGTPLTVGTTDVTGVDFALPRAGLVQTATVEPNGVLLGNQIIAFFDGAGRKVQRQGVGQGGAADVQLVPGTYYARTEPVSGSVMTTYGTGPCARGACDPRDGTPITVTFSGATSVSIPVAACIPKDISPSILASGVAGRPFRQVFRTSTPNTSLYVTRGRLPVGLSLDAATGVFSGTPTESGTFHFSVASVDAGGCAFEREYTLHVARCAFTLSPGSATVSAAGGPVTVTASDVCGYSTIETQVSWITPDATTASASTPLTIAVGPNPQAESRVGTATIGRRVFTVRQAGQGSSPPFGFVEAPANGAEVSGSLGISGWVLDDVQVTRVRILRDAVAGEAAGTLVYVGDAVLVDGARPDVERAYPSLPFNSRAGWGYLLLTNMLPNQGNGTFVLHAFADDAEGHSVLLGSRVIVAANSAATGPFGAIDTPAQGETIAGTAYRNWGWALTGPNPRFIPTGGSTIHVLIDGVPVGTPVYNLFRPDVAGLFPGLANSSGPVGYRDLDTTALAEGVHTIAWVVYDNTGAGAGIGSRYFTVRNSADAQPSGLFMGPETGQRAASLLASGATRAYRLPPLQRLSTTFPAAVADGCAMAYSAYLVANGDVRDLPAGAAMSADGEFTWQPGPAFNGRYEFAIVGTSCRGVRSRESLLVDIIPMPEDR